jgi:hypothetical protein
MFRLRANAPLTRFRLAGEPTSPHRGEVTPAAAVVPCLTNR